MPTGQGCAVSNFNSRLRFSYLVKVEFVRLLAEVWVVCWLFTKVVAKLLGAPSHKRVCVGDARPDDHHHVLQICILGLYF